MRQNIPNPDQVAFLLKLVQKAGASVMRLYGGTNSSDGGVLSINYKCDNSPVTVADLAAHRILVDGLSHLTPEIPVVSEEDGESMRHRRPTGTFWLIDPLDGTKEFISRNGEFTVNVALVENGVPILGVVLAPCLDLMYWGGVGIGAFRQKADMIENLSLSNQADKTGRPMIVVASRSHLNEETTQFIGQLGACELVQAGSSLKFCLIAEGSADVYPRMGPTSEWDTAAAQVIVEAAGGYVCTLDGEPLRYGKPDVLNPYFIASGTRFQRSSLQSHNQ